MAFISRYTFSNCTTLAIGCYLYYDDRRTQPITEKWVKVTLNDVARLYLTNFAGQIIQIHDCGWSSTQYYSAVFSGTKNDCVAGSCSVYGSTVNLNDGNPANAYVTSGSASSTLSQADADAKAFQIAYNLFEANKQARVNQLGFCTWSYGSGSGSYNANFTRNNCAANCYGTTVNYGNSQSGYYAESTISCQDAINKANTAAYNAAVNVVNANGQNHANSVGGCCCWNLEYYCDGCNRRSRERDSCTNATRNDTLVASNSCQCGNTCAGTYWSYYCSGTTRFRELKYSCDNSYAGTTETFQTCSPDCGASTSPTYTSQGYTTCYNCVCREVFRDTNSCSGSNGTYYVDVNGSKISVGGQPTGGCGGAGSGCNNTSNCVDSGSPYCSGNNWVINQTQANPCSSQSCGVRVIEYNSSANGCVPTCYNYNIINYNAYDTVYVSFQICGGGNTTLSFTDYSGTSGTVGSVCAVAGTVSITSGNGAASQGGSCT